MRRWVRLPDIAKCEGKYRKKRKIRNDNEAEEEDSKMIEKVGERVGERLAHAINRGKCAEIFVYLALETMNEEGFRISIIYALYI